MARDWSGWRKAVRPDLIKVDDETLSIPLRNGAFALIDAEDAFKVSQYLWRADSRGYVTSITRVGQPKKTVQVHLKLHRLIIDGDIIDHINGDKLDNRKRNLRVVSALQNSWNTGKQCVRATSKYKGVSWHRKTAMWQCHICVNGKPKYLGTFRSEEEAAKVYDEVALSLRGEYARLNFPRALQGN